MNKKYYNVELSKKEANLLMDFLSKINITFENSYINSNYCHMEISLSPEEITMVNNFLDTL